MLRFSVCIRNSTSTQIVTVDTLKHREKFIIKDQCKLFTVTMWFHVRNSLKLHVMLNYEQYPQTICLDFIKLLTQHLSIFMNSLKNRRQDLLGGPDRRDLIGGPISNVEGVKLPLDITPQADCQQEVAIDRIS